MSRVSVTNNVRERRYEARVDGALAGYAGYDETPEVIAFTHTKVEPAYEGKGVGGALARAAMDDVRERGDRQVVAVCPYIVGWFDKHPDYQSLLADGATARRYEESHRA